MGCTKLTYQNFSFLELIHPKKRVCGEKKRIKKYAGNFIYENNVLQFFNTPEGYVEPNGSNWNYVYQYKDHLGNIRLSYQDKNNDGVITASTEIVEENNYYPFGLKHKGYNANINGRHHKYMFGGKELQDELGLDLYDYGNRNYDATLGRFLTIDRFSQKYLNKSPYHYGANNPILYADKAGDSIIVTTNKRLYDGIKGNTKTVPSRKLAGQTYLVAATSSWKHNETTKEIDANFYIQEQFSPLVKPGAKNPFTSKNNKGLGIGFEIRAHEKGHVEQFTEIIKNSNDFSVILRINGKDKTFSGSIQSILDDVYANNKDMSNEILKDLMDQGYTKDEAEKALKDIQKDNMFTALDSINEQIKNKALDYNDAENDANLRSYKYFGGKKSYYNSARRSIIWWGNN